MTLHRLINSQLYGEAFVAPARVADHLRIVTGYASPAMLSRVLADFPNIRVSLIVGMVGLEGILLSDHEGFLALQAQHESRVNISYTKSGTSVHTKLYIWSNGGAPTVGFAGSSNFTHNGFLIGTRARAHSELLIPINPGDGAAEFDRLARRTVSITDSSLPQYVRMRLRARTTGTPLQLLNLNETPDITNAPSIILPLVRTSQPGRGFPHDKWGLNWGQRPGRAARSEAGIPVPSRAHQVAPNFFPTGAPHNRPRFAVHTDDSETIFMVVAEQGDKVLHSVPSNAQIGKWFRRRLGVTMDAKVTMEDLRRFGSRFVKIYRLDDEAYYLTYNSSLETEGIAQYGFPQM